MRRVYKTPLQRERVGVRGNKKQIHSARHCVAEAGNFLSGADLFLPRAPQHGTKKCAFDRQGWRKCRFCMERKSARRMRIASVIKLVARPLSTPASGSRTASASRIVGVSSSQAETEFDRGLAYRSRLAVSAVQRSPTRRSARGARRTREEEFLFEGFLLPFNEHAKRPLTKIFQKNMQSLVEINLPRSIRDMS
jgi:hypothetical protein